ncbi:MAG: hypothetical protein ACK4NZ_12125 [Tsuneonella sp.]
MDDTSTAGGSELWAACADWALLALAKNEAQLTPIEEAQAITEGAKLMIDAGAYLEHGKLMFP